MSASPVVRSPRTTQGARPQRPASASPRRVRRDEVAARHRFTTPTVHELTRRVVDVRSDATW